MSLQVDCNVCDFKSRRAQQLFACIHHDPLIHSTAANPTARSATFPSCFRYQEAIIKKKKTATRLRSCKEAGRANHLFGPAPSRSIATNQHFPRLLLFISTDGERVCL
jgi:hypothetical protein